MGKPIPSANPGFPVCSTRCNVSFVSKNEERFFTHSLKLVNESPAWGNAWVEGRDLTRLR